MLEAYNKDRILKDLEARLPEAANEVKPEIEDVLKSHPTDSFALFLLARCYLQNADLNAAKDTFRTIIDFDPVFYSAKRELAKILFEEGDQDAAIDLLNELTNARPDFVENWQLLSEYLKHSDKEQANSNALLQYDLIKTFNDNLGTAERAFANAEFIRSDNLCRKLLEQVPNEVRVLRLLARLAKQFRHFEISRSILAPCIEVQPTNADLGIEYAKALLETKKYKDALDQCQRLIELAPEKIDLYKLKAEILYNLARFDEAIEIYRELTGVDEGRALNLLHLGKLLKTVGETSEAVSFFKQGIAQDPRLGQSYWELANLRTYVFSADETSAMKRLVEADNIAAINRVLIQFALGKAMEDSKEYTESFQYYQSANSTFSELRPYRHSSHNTPLKSFYSAEYFARRKQAGHDSDAPIFVVGLPRSGSTLLEQILSSHSQIDSTMELTEVVSIVSELNQSSLPGQGQYPQSVARLTAVQVQGLAQRYLEFVQPMRQQAPHFVDKQPVNYLHIGLIKTLFPKARIIDIRRKPMAIGWSLYRHFFADSFLFSYDLTNIGKYYRSYVELMDHWHRVLPEQILTVNYEDLVNDFPATVNTLLQYCGLEFEEACIDFHLNKRAVATPSSEQVRQPLYSDALDHWKNYDAFLTPLKHALGKYAV